LKSCMALSTTMVITVPSLMARARP
jgi:hypothetical protein